MSIETLKEYGLEEMDEGEIDDFLSSQGFGVLGLPDEDAPYLLPMSFGYDGGSRLYFSYFLGSGSRKKELSDSTEYARFLVYSAESAFSWESVALTGRLSRLPESEWDEHADAMENAWHLDIFEKAGTAGGIEIYEFEVKEKVGIRYAELPPGFERQS